MKWITALLFVALAGCQHRVQFYAGSKRDVSSIARVYNTRDIMVNAVDGEEVADKLKFLQPQTSYSDFILELEPGEHRLTVSLNTVIPAQGHWQMDGCGHSMYVTDQPAYVAQLSTNRMTLRHRFEAGKSYSFLLKTTHGPRDGPGTGIDATADGTWQPMLVEKGSTSVQATPEMSPPTTIAAGVGGATVSGVAQVPLDDGQIVTATGQQVSLLPSVPVVHRWLDKTNAKRHSWFQLFPPKLPDDIRRQIRTAQPIAQGQYVFTGVEAGEYIVLFMFGRSMATAKVQVASDDRHIVADALRVMPD